MLWRELMHRGPYNILECCGFFLDLTVPCEKKGWFCDLISNFVLLPLQCLSGHSNVYFKKCPMHQNCCLRLSCGGLVLDILRVGPFFFLFFSFFGGCGGVVMKI